MPYSRDEEASRLQVKIASATGATTLGDMSDVSPRGITLEYSGRRPPIYTLGAPIWVVLSTKDERRPLKLAGAVERRWDDGRCRRYYFGFAGAVDLAHLHTLGVVGLINQRQSFRVKPADGEVVPVTIYSPDGQDKAKGTLSDISEGGMGIVGPKFLEQKMAATTTMKTALTLPGGRLELTILSDIVFRGIAGPSVRYGLSFDRERTPHFRAIQQRVGAYVMLRQRELLAEERKAKR